jgi:ATP-dependent protease HslVU (ClpYQ) peptidase subunit
MTCIVGLVNKGKVYIGGDSAGVAGSNVVVRSDEKVFVSHGMAFGFTSSFRMGQILRYCFKPPEDTDKDAAAYMVAKFIPELQRCFSANGYERTINGEKSAGTFFVGYKGRLFIVESDYQVGENNIGYASVGCGDCYALGSMYSTQRMKPQARVLEALTAAEHFSTGVRGPFKVVVAP